MTIAVLVILITAPLGAISIAISAPRLLTQHVPTEEVQSEMLAQLQPGSKEDKLEEANEEEHCRSPLRASALDLNAEKEDLV